MKYEIEEEAGGYVRNGDVLEWAWKDEAEKEKPAEAEQEPAKRKPGRPKKTTN